MAEGWARALGGGWMNVESAGIEAHGKNPRAIAAMAEAGVDISGQESTKLTGEMLRRADYVVTVCGNADERCPALPPGVGKEHWPLSDPARAEGPEAEIMDVFRETCSDIRARVEALIERLRADLRISRIRTIEKGKQQLSAEQRRRLEDLLTEPRVSRPYRGWSR